MQNSRWKPAFFALLAFSALGGVWGAERLIDQHLQLDLARLNSRSWQEERAFRVHMLEQAYAGSTKDNFIAAARRALPQAQVKEDPPLVFVGSYAFEFDSNGKFVREVHPE